MNGCPHSDSFPVWQAAPWLPHWAAAYASRPEIHNGAWSNACGRQGRLEKVEEILLVGGLEPAFFHSVGNQPNWLILFRVVETTSQVWWMQSGERPSVWRVCSEMGITIYYDRNSRKVREFTRRGLIWQHLTYITDIYTPFKTWERFTCKNGANGLLKFPSERLR